MHKKVLGQKDSPACGRTRTLVALLLAIYGARFFPPKHSRLTRSAPRLLVLSLARLHFIAHRARSPRSPFESFFSAKGKKKASA